MVEWPRPVSLSSAVQTSKSPLRMVINRQRHRECGSSCGRGHCRISTLERDSGRLGDFSSPSGGHSHRALAAVRRYGGTAADHHLSCKGHAFDALQGRLATQRMLSNQTALKPSARYSRGRPGSVIAPSHEGRRRELNGDRRNTAARRVTARPLLRWRLDAGLATQGNSLR